MPEPYTTGSRAAKIADRIQYLLDDGWPSTDIAEQIVEEFGDELNLGYEQGYEAP